MHSDGQKKLPSEQELCRAFSCSRQTIRSALGILEDRGLITKRRGSGSYLTDIPVSFEASNKILFITEDQDEYIYPDLIASLRKLLENRNLSLICLNTGGSIQTERKHLEKVLLEPPAAVILDPLRDTIPNPNLGVIEEIRKMDIPVIYLNSAYTGGSTSFSTNIGSKYSSTSDSSYSSSSRSKSGSQISGSKSVSPTSRSKTGSSNSCSRSCIVSEDNKGGASLLVHHLAEHGHRNIAGLFRIDESRGISRYQGCISACLDLGLPFNEESYYLYSSSEKKQLLRNDNGMLLRFIEKHLPGNTAVICQNDLIAYRLIELLRSKNLGNIAVASFDNSYYAKNQKITSLGHKENELSLVLFNTIQSILTHQNYTPTPLTWTLHPRTST